MKYAHLADLHLGAWREEKLKDLSTRTFLTAIDQCISNQVDFILLAGDLFNTSLPSLDILKIVTKKLKELKDKYIPLYVIAGSHDFSPSGKTIIDVLENAGLMINVCKGEVDQETKQLKLKFTTDPKTGIKITGVLGRKGLLDKTYYQNLYRESLENEPGYKIFLFHTTITELKPKYLEMLDSQPVSFLPKNFNYYAGGHIHHPTKMAIPGYGTLTYPGALFPDNFSELEKYSHGGYYLIDEEKIEWIPVEIIKHKKIDFDGHHPSPEVVAFEILNHFHHQDLNNTLITIRLQGSLHKGKVSDIDFKHIFEQLYRQGAYFVMKNTSKLYSEEYEDIKISSSNPETIEDDLIKEHLQQMNLFDKETEWQLIKSLITALNTIRKEGETVADFQKRVDTETNKLLRI